ncbi:ADP-ribosylation factor-like protein 6 [Tetrabaena socialis]|uniref:ADP-ribosylation factor-like protein 6 n=1 Tax=Tetrabaena socialis TaxID=47790 RepID=A0A2J7ZTD7_9CHLO|nr:ADP-ribosylation factor-like protein 6 [Tetrabaena socialis]|eukprot:PNH03535.1 ADP-ribosylation factor-like protein 6 [Tetrabaena socialis]
MRFLRGLLIKLGLVKGKVGLLVLGLSNSGKSTVVARLTKEPVEDVAPTVGFAVETVKLDGLTVTMFDMSGNQRYQELWKHYYKDTTAIMFVLDAADNARFAEADTVLRELLTAEPLKMSPSKNLYTRVQD